MRHIRTRHKLKRVAVLLLSLLAVLFFEDRVESFVPEVKGFAAAKFEEALKGNASLSIGGIDGGLLHPITLNDVEIRNDRNSSIFPSLMITSVKTNYRIQDVLFRAKNIPFIGHLISGSSRADILFSTRGKEVSGILRLEADSSNFVFNGQALINGRKIEVNGIIDPVFLSGDSEKSGPFYIEARSAKGSIKIKGLASKSGGLSADLRLEHWRIGAIDVVCDAELRMPRIPDMKEGAGAHVEGSLRTKNTVLNYKPLADIDASFEIRGSKLVIKSMSLGEAFRLYGNISMKSPNALEACLTANNVSLSWLFNMLGAKDSSAVLAGVMNGKFNFKGTPSNMKSDVHLEIRKGAILGLDFDCMSAELKGHNSLFRIEDSNITRQSGYLKLAGEIDLANAGKPNFFGNIRLASDDKAINWDGLDVSSVQNVKEFNFKKKLTEDIDFNLKKFVSEEKVDESNRFSDEVELNYKLHPNESLKITVGNDKNFMGLEHKDKF